MRNHFELCPVDNENFENKIVMDLQISVNSDQSLSNLGLHYLFGCIRRNI